MSQKPLHPTRQWFEAHRENIQLLKFWLVSAAIAVSVVLPLRAALADWHDVPTGSMRPSIIEGDRIFVRTSAYGLRIPLTRTWLARWGEPARGDVVTLASPVDGSRLVKRVIGMPGDRLAMRRGQLILNGEPLRYRVVDREIQEELPTGQMVPAMLLEEGLPGRAHPVTWTSGISSRRDFDEIEIPQDHYFVMGDNRDQSLDSRYFGVVPLEHIYGRSSHVVFSLDRSHYFLPRKERWVTAIP